MNNIKMNGKGSALLKTICLAAFYLLMAVAIERILAINERSGVIALLVSAGFFPALVTGAIFRELTLRKDGISSASPVYNADLAGSAAGFIVFSGLIIPLLGIKSSLFLLPALIFTGFLFALIKNKR
jgi:hypothetical protein